MSQALPATSTRKPDIIPNTMLIATAALGSLIDIDNSAVLPKHRLTPANRFLACSIQGKGTRRV